MVLCPLGRLCHFVRLCALSQVVLPAARYVPRRREHQWLLLAFDFITHEVPDILIECLVFGLPDEADLV